MKNQTTHKVNLIQTWSPHPNFYHPTISWNPHTLPIIVKHCVSVCFTVFHCFSIMFRCNTLFECRCNLKLRVKSGSWIESKWWKIPWLLENKKLTSTQRLLQPLIIPSFWGRDCSQSVTRNCINYRINNVVKQAECSHACSLANARCKDFWLLLP